MLGWDPKDFEGMTRIIIPWDKVWIPDTVLYNWFVGLRRTGLIEKDSLVCFSVEMTRSSSERWISVIYDTDVDYLNKTGETRAQATFQVRTASPLL